MQGQGRAISIKLDITEYQVPAQDSKGHSGRIEFRVNTGLLHDIEVLLHEAKPLTGWKTSSEFYRWAIMYGLQTMAGRVKSQRLTNALAVADLISKGAQRLAADARVLGCLDDVQRTVAELQARNAPELIPAMLADWKRQIGTVDLPYWRKRLNDEFDKRFGHLLRPIDLRDHHE